MSVALIQEIKELQYVFDTYSYEMEKVIDELRQTLNKPVIRPIKHDAKCGRNVYEVLYDGCFDRESQICHGLYRDSNNNEVQECGCLLASHPQPSPDWTIESYKTERNLTLKKWFKHLWNWRIDECFGFNVKQLHRKEE